MRDRQEKVVICASASLSKEITEWKEKLENSGYNVINYPSKIQGNVQENYKKEFMEHYKSIGETDIVLVLNLKTKGTSGYIGGGVFAEMAFAVGLNKIRNREIKVRYLKPLPEDLPYSDELKLWQNLDWIKQFEL